tara:strand:+ start:3450 stop:5447 length:1998 start_codon:yes stop_codon:yes gene_type:complete
MAETLISPGVLARENDNSFIATRPYTKTAAIIGPTVKGPVEIPTIVTSYSDYLSRFGSTLISASNIYSYFTSISAFNFFSNGGEALLVSRVVSGSYTQATSTTIYNDVESGVLALADLGAGTGGTYTDVADATYPGIALTGSLSGTGAIATVVLTTELVTSVTVTTPGSGFAVGEVITFAGSLITDGVDVGSGTQTVTTLIDADIVDNNTFTLKTFSEGIIMNSSSSVDASGSLADGTSNNLRFNIQNVSTSSGTFDLLVRQGNDNTNNQIVLETWTGLSLDPTSPNFVSKVIGDVNSSYDVSNNQIVEAGNYKNNSRYIYVSSVSALTPNYFNNTGNFKSEYTASLPIPTQGSFTGAVGDVKAGANFYNTIDGANTQGLVAGNYTNMIALMANQDAYKFNSLIIPGLYDSDANYSVQLTNVINNTQYRGDNLFILDLVPFASSVNTVTTKSSNRNTSYAASYWPWLQMIDPDTAQLVWVPASTVMPGVFSYNDTVSEPWFAPAGINRGGLNQVVKAEYKLTQTQRDSLYTGKVNPIASFPATGTVVYGQKTLQTKASALDRVNVRRLLIALKNYISGVAQGLVFEQNTIATRNAFLSQVNPYLETVQQRQGLYAFKVIMDESNNSADVVDRNQMVGQIYLQPTKTAEFIYLDFNILPTGATFPA